MSIQVLNIKLQRTDPSVSWGFNIQGGRDFHSPFMVQKVAPNSLADQSSVQQGDYILRIGNNIIENFTHAQAREAIIAQGNHLELTLQRGSAPRSEDYSFNFAFPQHRLMNPDNIERVPVASPQVGLQLNSNKALLTQSYNSPMGLYSNQNISETMTSALKNMNIKDPKLMQEAQKLKQLPKVNPMPSTVSNKPNFSPQSPTVTQFKPYQQQQPAPYYQPQSYHQPPPVSPQYQPQPAPQYQSQPAPHYQPQPAPQYQPVQPSYKPTAPRVPAPVPSPAGPRNFNRGSKGSAVFNNANHGPSQPQCAACFQVIRGPFISAVGKIWCPNHFVCANPSCGANLHDLGFVEENGKLYCERDYEKFAPKCYKCQNSILGECCYALEKSFHPECFVCGKCKQKIGSGNFHIEDGVPYCERDFNALFSVKCAGCQFPIEAGDKFVEALNEKYHVECFTCTKCNAPLNGGFAMKGNKPFCKKHAY